MSLPLLALGPVVFEILPLSLQRLAEHTRVKWPAIGRFGNQSARQFTGYGDDSFRIEGLFYNEEWGGFDDYLALKALQRNPEPVDMIGGAAAGSYATVFGPVVILDVGATHEHIGQGGIGRKVTFSVELAPFGADAYGPGGMF